MFLELLSRLEKAFQASVALKAQPESSPHAAPTAYYPTSLEYSPIDLPEIKELTSSQWVAMLRQGEERLLIGIIRAESNIRLTTLNLVDLSYSSKIIYQEDFIDAGPDPDFTLCELDDNKLIYAEDKAMYIYRYDSKSAKRIMGAKWEPNLRQKRESAKYRHNSWASFDEDAKCVYALLDGVSLELPAKPGKFHLLAMYNEFRHAGYGMLFVPPSKDPELCSLGVITLEQLSVDTSFLREELQLQPQDICGMCYSTTDQCGKLEVRKCGHLACAVCLEDPCNRCDGSPVSELGELAVGELLKQTAFVEQTPPIQIAPDPVPMQDEETNLDPEDEDANLETSSSTQFAIVPNYHHSIRLTNLITNRTENYQLQFHCKAIVPLYVVSSQDFACLYDSLLVRSDPTSNVSYYAQTFDHYRMRTRVIGPSDRVLAARWGRYLPLPCTLASFMVFDLESNTAFWPGARRRSAHVFCNFSVDSASRVKIECCEPAKKLSGYPTTFITLPESMQMAECIGGKLRAFIRCDLQKTLILKAKNGPGTPDPLPNIQHSLMIHYRAEATMALVPYDELPWCWSPLIEVNAWLQQQPTQPVLRFQELEVPDRRFPKRVIVWVAPVNSSSAEKEIGLICLRGKHRVQLCVPVEGESIYAEPVKGGRKIKTARCGSALLSGHATQEEAELARNNLRKVLDRLAGTIGTVVRLSDMEISVCIPGTQKSEPKFETQSLLDLATEPISSTKRGRQGKPLLYTNKSGFLLCYS